MIKAVLFDLDGTLVNSITDLANAANYALSCDNFPEHDISEYKLFVGDGMPKLIERCLPEAHRSNTQLEKTLGIFSEHYSEHYADNTSAYDGINQLLQQLKNRKILIAVVSNKAQEFAEQVVRKTFGDIFKVVIGKRKGMPAKPDPACAFLAMDELGVSPKECLFVGDSGNDTMTGVNCGAISVGVLWGFREREELLENGAKYIIDTPLKLIEIVDSINNLSK